MIMEAFWWLQWQLMKLLYLIEVPYGVWELQGSLYGGIYLVLGYTNKLPFVPWDAVATTLGLILGLWLFIFLGTVLIQFVSGKWGQGREG